MAGDVQNGRPSLLAITRAVNALIYTDLVATQPTTQPKATLFGLRYLNPDNNISFETPSTYAGRYGDRSDITELSNSSKFEKGDIFKFETVVYQAAAAVNISTENGSDLKSKLMISMMKANVRIVSDAADTSYHETGDNIQEVNFSLDRWAVDTRTRKFKTLITNELIQDLNANGLDASSVIEDLLSTTLSEEINKDIMQKLQTVSKRFISQHTTDGILDLSGISDDPIHGRTVYRIVSEMAYEILSDTTFEATYVLCTPKIAALLSASGWMKGDPSMVNLYAGVLANGIKVYIDGVSEMEYMVVGTKQATDEFEKIGSLFYSPFIDIDSIGSFNFALDPSDMQPRIMAMSRYALSVNPYTVQDEKSDREQIVNGDAWIDLATKSKYSRFVGVLI